MGDAASQVDAPLQNLTNSLFSFALLENVLGQVFGGAEQVIEMAEAVQNLESRLNLAVEGFGDADQAMLDVQEIAKATGAELGSVGDLYVKIAGTAQAVFPAPAGMSRS